MIGSENGGASHRDGIPRARDTIDSGNVRFRPRETHIGGAIEEAISGRGIIEGGAINDGVIGGNGINFSIIINIRGGGSFTNSPVEMVRGEENERFNGENREGGSETAAAGKGLGAEIEG